MLAELRAELRLSAEQSRRVQEIFARYHAEGEAAWTQGHANHHLTMQRAMTEIKTVLDSGQIERLHAWLARRHDATSHHAPGQAH